MITNNTAFKRTAGVLLPVLLLCLCLLAGCGKDKTKDGETANVSPTAAMTSSPTATTAPTATPTPTVPFVRRTYETYVRDDIFRIPVEELMQGWYSMPPKCAGEYTLLWFVPPESGEEYDAENVFVLLQPCVSEEQHRLSVDYLITEPILLADGTVILEERDTFRIHVFDNTMKEESSFLPRVEKASWMLGVSESGEFWHADNEGSKLLATDRGGQPAGEYDVDPKYEVTRYIGTEGGRRIFLTVLKDSNAFGFLIIPENGEIYYRDETEANLGDDWNADRIAPVSLPDTVTADSTWFFHTPGFLREGVAFPKNEPGEEQYFLQGETLCGSYCRWIDDDTCVREYRLYDMENRTVSEMIPESVISGCAYLSPKGVVSGCCVVMLASMEEGTDELLLWDVSGKTSPINGFCEFAKDNVADCLADRLKEVKESCGVEITPDRTEDDGTLEALGDLMAELDFVNSFALAAKKYPETLTAKAGNTVHPENIRNNDGAHYTFNPHVFSTILLQQHGEKRRDNFFRFVDALRAGEDRFACTDRDSADWCCSMAHNFYPVGGVYASASYVGNGWAEITYEIPKEEFLEKARDFEERICAVLNDVLEDDYTDFEKALAMYEFLTEYCVYDYEMLDHSLEWMDRQSAYRVLIEKRGICGEIASLYCYLLLQCGVDVEETSGAPTDPDIDLHAWNYIVLGGKGYLIDATWGLSDRRRPDLAFFLFTDERRENRDGFDFTSCTVGICPLYEARGKYSFTADDDRYSALWNGTYVAFDEDEKCIFYRDMNGVLKRFDYGE